METALFNSLNGLLPHTEAWVFFFKRMSFFGSGLAIFLLVTIAVTYLLLRAEFHKAHILVLGGVSSIIFSKVIKNLVGRPRPDILPHLEQVSSLSFPSGHSLSSLVVYGILAVFIAEAHPRWRKPIYSVTGIFIFLIGYSRIYLAVHWPTDVIAGWIIGGILLALLIAWYRRGDILRMFRIAFGILMLIFGLIGCVLPIIPGIPLLIGGFILAFTNRRLSEIFKKKRQYDPKRDIIIEPADENNKGPMISS